MARLVSIMLFASILFQSQAFAKGHEFKLQGVFCNTEVQIDKAAAYMAMRLAPRTAVELVNRGDVVCNYVDLIHYLVESPLMVGAVGGSSVRIFKYQVTLKAVSVGGVVRDVTPPAQIFFVTPRAITGVPVAGRA